MRPLHDQRADTLSDRTMGVELLHPSLIVQWSVPVRLTCFLATIVPHLAALHLDTIGLLSLHFNPHQVVDKRRFLSTHR